MSITIPSSYPEWRHCIEVICRQPLTAEFIAQRLSALANVREYSTARFIERYGPVHHQCVQEWFAQAGNELAPSLPPR